MSEVKYAIAILKEKLANADRHNLAYQRLSIADMEAIWGTLEKSDKDCTTLKAERDALAVECAQYKSLAERFAERADDYKSGHFGYSVFDSSNEFKQHIKTPATDAYLDSVRAEGVDKAIAHLHKKFEGTGHIGVPVMALESLANQLRAGEPS